MPQRSDHKEEVAKQGESASIVLVSAAVPPEFFDKVHKIFAMFSGPRGTLAENADSLEVDRKQDEQ